MISWPLLRYLLASYTRSNRYFPPIAFIIISVLILYSYKPNPVMDSYAVTSSLLFIGCAWLGTNFLNHDQGRQNVLLILHTGSAKVFYVTQYAVLVLICSIISTATVVYPMFTGMFDEPVGWSRFVIALMAHISLSGLGAAVALFFQSGWIENQGRATGLMLILIVLSIAGLSLADSLPASISILVYLLPPASPMIDMLMHSDQRGIARSIYTLLFSFGYTAVLLIIYLKAALAKDAAELIRKAG
ncbi:hypothetical protein SAMN05661091_2110 [Paenibacillus uliginis N3/975]|uniref:Uncharacterized protein n=1 Tax=Paenibacillus uliginis N3/975 TaxID=1313296 RepID=A0A1X7H9J2_9BACL|nr:hypothetical protein [Paenibacillus uliginis]SMF82112.1 hypothetical protein SAMN05661091_2110 [Paenibacillus uliginis N3/975]